MPSRVLHGMDRDVYHIILKFEEEHAANSNKPPRFTVAGIYDSIKRSNSSLARQKKRPLEDAIERVLRVRKEERVEDDEEAALDSQPVADSPQPKTRDYFVMNKQITKQWNIPRREMSTAATEPSASTSAVETTTAERQSNGEPKPKRRRAEKTQEDRSPPSDISLEDLGGMDSALGVLGESIAFPILYPKICAQVDLQGSRGVLLHGPPGCGKTMLANAFAATLGVPFIPVSAPSLVAGMSGESEKKIRELYEEAKKLAPCLVFIDEIDAIMGKRENAQREMEKRIVAQMLTCMDDLNAGGMENKVVATIAATNRPDSIDPALRRAGRFNQEISLGIPNEASREAILNKLLRRSRLSEDVDTKGLAKRTPGFVGADLKDVVQTAKNDMIRGLMSSVARSTPSGSMEVDSDNDKPPFGPGLDLILKLKAGVDNELAEEETLLTMSHLVNAIGKVQPSSKREGFTTIPDTTWSHVGALENVRKQLELSIVEPIQEPEKFAKLGLANVTSGVILWGPPGCGKTLLAKAVANESKANFISVKGPELLNKYVGESEKAVRQVFSRAVASAPCILFFDELDALVPKRDGAIGDSTARVVNQLLTELDGMDSRAGVYVVGATNRPDMIDPAIMRPGRLGKHIFVDLPDEDGRVDILKRRITRLIRDYHDLELLERVARDGRCHGFSGADMDNLHIAAAEAAFERSKLSGPDIITEDDWEVALETVKQSVSDGHSDKFRVLKETGWE